MSQQVRPVPEGFHTVTPHIVIMGEGAAAALQYYAKAFGAVEISRMPGPGGKLMHAQMRIGDSIIMLADYFPEFGSFPVDAKASPVFIHLYVNDVDAVFQQAIAAGATPLLQPADMFWGDRYAMLADPFGHRWSVATHKRDMTPQEMQEAMQKMDMAHGCPGGQA
jgi:uncharacterized glyoxalase superfamily protein PhnB